MQLRVPGEPHALALIRKLITYLAAEAGFAEEEVDKIEIAVDEACTNAMEHAYKAHTPKPPVQVNIQAAGGRFVVDIIDEGERFDFDSYVPPKFPDHWNAGHTRGVGLYLIQQCMDEMSYERVEGRCNRLRLVKLLDAP